jgi:excisionase family DNA binding protein
MTITLQNTLHYTIAEAAPRMGYTLFTLRNYCKNGTVASIKVGGRRYISETTIQAHLNGDN